MTMSTSHLGGWGTPEDRALRGMSLSAGVMVTKHFLESVPKCGHFLLKVGKILPVKGKFFSGPKKSLFSLTSFQI